MYPISGRTTGLFENSFKANSPKLIPETGNLESNYSDLIFDKKNKNKTQVLFTENVSI